MITFYPYFRARKDETRIRYFSGSNFSGNSSTDYGLQMESIARKKFEEVTGFSVIEVGLVIRYFAYKILIELYIFFL